MPPALLGCLEPHSSCHPPDSQTVIPMHTGLFSTQPPDSQNCHLQTKWVFQMECSSYCSSMPWFAVLGWEQWKLLWTLSPWRLLRTGDHVRVSHIGLLPSSQWFDDVWEQLWPLVGTIGCMLLSIKGFTKIPEGHVETFKDSKLFENFIESKLLKQERKLFSGMHSLVLLKMSWLATSPCIASVSAGNWKNYLSLSKDAGEKASAERWAIVWAQESQVFFLQACKVI